MTINLGNTQYKGTGTSDVSVSLPAYPTSLKNPSALTITLDDGTTKTVYDGSEAKSIALTRLWKASEVTSATSDEGTITPLAMNQWTTSRYVTAIGTNGNYLTYTKNGVAQNVTIPYATTANQLTKWKVLTIKKNTDAGTVYKLIADLSNWKTGYNGQWGMVGMMYGHRGGNMAGTTIQKIVAYCAAWSSDNGGADYEVKTDITTYVKPCIVSYNGVTYLALKMTGSGSSREHSFLGYTENLLEEFIEVSESAATLVHDTEVMSMGGVNAASATKLKTPRTLWGQSFDGTDNVSGNISLMTSKVFWHGDSSNYYISCPTGSSSAYLEYKSYGGHSFVAANTNVMRITSSLRVGVGTDSPSYKFQVNGTSASNTVKVLSEDMVGHLNFSRASANYITAPSSGSINFVTNGKSVSGANSDFVVSDGSVKIAGISLSKTQEDVLYIDGNLVVRGGVTMYGSSDKRLKKNIRTFQAGKELMSLGGVYQFEYEDEEISRNAMYKGTHVGLMYQNVKGTILDKMCYEREDGYGALNYLDSSFISLLAGVGVEHETRIQRLERENEELRKEIEQLKKV